MEISKTICVNIDNNLDGKTIKTVLRSHLGISAAIMTKLKKYPDGILLGGVRQNVNKVVKCGDMLTLNIRDAASQNIEPVNIPLDIIYEDEEILAVNKPRNMPTHPSQNHHHDTLANGVAYLYNGKGFTFRPITRLDRDTSGVVLIAKNQLAASVLSDQMQSYKISKQYVAVCHGIFENKQGTIDAPIARAEGSGILRKVSDSGKQAVTEYQITEEFGNLSIVKLTPKTGRTHQLRVHMAHLRHPIYGDDMYGSDVQNASTLLHCQKICFYHPHTKELMEICAPMPQDIMTIIKNA